MADPVIRTDFIKQLFVGNIFFTNRITSIAQLVHNLALGFRQQIGVFLKDLNDLVSRKIGLLLLLLLSD